MIGLDVSADMKAFGKGLDDFSRRQLPFATAQALNVVAAKAAEAERAALQSALGKPTPFTLRGIAVERARKDRPTAWVYIQQIQARYLAPSIEGGTQVLGAGRAVLVPVNIRVDQYGNIPPGTLQALRARPDVFIGKVTFANGSTASGVWQLPPGQRKGGGRGGRITGGRRSGWKLLIRFADPLPVRAAYRFGQAAVRTAAREFPGELAAQLRKAMATAKP